MKKNALLALLTASVLFMAGCSDSPNPDMDAENRSDAKSSQVDQKVDGAQVSEEKMPGGEMPYKATLVIEDNGEVYNKMVVPVDGKNLNVKLPVVFFDFDKFNLNADMEDKIKNFSEYVKDNNLDGKTFHIGGHCDEWGADEYNIALGLKRAKTVEKSLKNYGIDSKVTLTSYGESKPICFDHNKNCWRLNRRAEIKILP